MTLRQPACRCASHIHIAGARAQDAILDSSAWRQTFLEVIKSKLQDQLQDADRRINTVSLWHDLKKVE